MINKIVDEDICKIVSSEKVFEQYKNKTIFITGVGGMLASYIVYAFLYLNDFKSYNTTIIGCVRNEQKAKKHFSKIINRLDFKLHIQDVCDPIKIKDDVNYIFHLASQPSPKSFVFDPVGTLKVNTIGTYNVLELARERNVEGFLYASTREIYGQQFENVELVKEDNFGFLNPAEIRNCYPEGKRVSETMCVCYGSQYSVPYSIVRIGHTYGYGMNLYDGRVIADLTKCAVMGQNIILKSDGSKRFAISYISDTVEGIFLANYKKNLNDIYNVSNENEVVSIKQIAEYLISAVPDKKLKIIYDIPYQTESLGYSKNNFGVLDCSKLREIGYNPRYIAKEGLFRTVQALL